MIHKITKKKSKKINKRRKKLIRINCNFNNVHLVKDCKQKIHLKSLEKQLKMHLFKNNFCKRNNLNQIKHFSKNKMIQECVFQCINHGHHYQSMVLKDSKEEIGIINIEDLYMFIQLRRSLLNLKLIQSNNSIQIFIKLLVKIYLHSQRDILQDVLQEELIQQMFLLIKNMKIQFPKNCRNQIILNIYSQ